MTVDTRIELLKIALALAITTFETENENDENRSITQIFEDCDTTVIVTKKHIHNPFY